MEDNEFDPADDIPPVNAVVEPGADFSFVDVFKQELQELAETETVLIPVKGYERTGLQVKYRLPESGKQLDDISRKVSREVRDSYTRNLLISMDTMIMLCEGLYVQPTGVDEPVQLDPQETGIAMGFDERLAEMMGMNGEVKSARAVIRKLFGSNELMIIAHAERLSRWLQNTKADLDAEIWQLGE